MGASDRFASRVVVSGRGIVCAIGCDVRTFAHSLAEGIGGIAALGAGSKRIGARVGGFGAASAGGPTDLAGVDRATQFALVCARAAVAESGLDAAGGLGPRAAVIVGNGSGCLNTIEHGYNQLFAQPPRRLHPMTVPRIMPNALAGHISLEFGVAGPAFTISTACASSAYAVMLGAQMIRAGTVDIAIVGGAEACLTDGNLKAWEALRVLAPDTCRPFSKGRRGLVLGEGGAMIVLESLDHARARGAPIFGEIAGGALNSDAHHLLAPSLDGQSEAIRACLRDAGMREGEVGYVNAHGTATTANDVTETRALRRIFGSGADRLRVSSTKSMHGHTLGAAGAIELLATLVGLERGFSPPTMNYAEPDPDCDLNYVPNCAQESRCTAALTNSFAFGGHNAVLALRAPQTV
ncbi:MAG: beta-ketoacyl-[acyl-carrier-protein] synthase family protein [Burkholderiaceae bacterium]